MPWLQKKSERSESDSTHAKPYYYIHVPTGHGNKALSTGTRSLRDAKRIASMVDSLYRGGRRDPFFLAWLIDRQLPAELRLKPLVLLKHYEDNTLADLKARHYAAVSTAAEEPAIDVDASIDAWNKDVQRRSSKDNADRFVRAVRSFVPEGEVVTTEHFSYSRLLDWANALQEPVESEGYGLGPESARRWRVGVLNFLDHLVATKVLGTNFLAQISPPRKGKPRDRHLTTGNAVRLVESFGNTANEPLISLLDRQGISVQDAQGYNALLCGAGVEVSVALDLVVGDFRRADREVRAPGTKNHNRDRVVRVAEWALPYVEACAAGRDEHERLFATIPNRWLAADVFCLAIAPLVAAEPKVFADYWMRDGRHTYAVRAIRAGTPPHVVAKQLGHADATLVHKIYGVYAPSSVERDHWEMAANAQDIATKQIKAGARRAIRAAPLRPAARTPANVGHTPKIAWPTKEELLHRLTQTSALSLARELGVSDAALRKHLRREGVARLPDGRRKNVAKPRA